MSGKAIPIDLKPDCEAGWRGVALGTSPTPLRATTGPQIIGNRLLGSRRCDAVDSAREIYDEQFPGLTFAEGGDVQLGVEQDGRLPGAPAEDLSGAVISVDISARQCGNGGRAIDIPAGDRAAPATMGIGGDRQG